MAWTEEQKQEVIEKYTAMGPTEANSTELVKTIAEEMDQSPNGVRQVLVQAKVYVKKDPNAVTTTAGKPTTKTGTAEGTKRVSKESQIAALKEAIEARRGAIDDDILSKLTGKAAAYFTDVLTK